MTRYTRFSTKELRDGVMRCLDESIQMVSDDRRARLFQAHTRWGKTLAIRLIAHCMIYGYVDPDTGEIVEPTASVHVLVTPSKFLVDQALDDKKWERNLRLYEVEAPVLGHCAIGSASEHTQINPNGERFLCVTIQQLAELDKRGILSEWIRHIHHRYGLPIVFHFDETHFQNEDKPWGELVVKVQSYGACTIGWTATPQRADNGLIPGGLIRVRGQMEGTETVAKGFYTDEKGQRWVQLEDRQVSITDLIVVPDVAITFSTGWNLGYILKVDHDFIDPTLEQLNIDGSEEGAKLLSELSASFIRKYGILRPAVEHPITIRKAVKEVIRHLPSFRSLHSTTKILFFSNTDTSLTKGTDDHARTIKRILNQEAPYLRVEIDTGNADEPGAAMKLFEDGQCDVLIVKRMGAVGWDVPDIMIVVDLSVDRTPARCMQAWMRGATHVDGVPFKKFVLILPQDRLAQDIFDSEIEREGGTATLKDISVIGEREEKVETQDKPIFNVTDVVHGDFLDSDRNAAHRSKLALVDWFLAGFPEVGSAYSQAYIAEMLPDNFTENSDDNLPLSNGRTDERIVDLQMRITSNIDEFAKLTGNYNPQRQREWVDHVQRCWHILRMRSGGYERFPRNDKGKVVTISKIRDMTLLETMERESLLMREGARRGQPFPTA